MTSFGKRSIPEPPVLPDHQPDLESAHYKIKTVTPMVGGGVDTGVIDRTQPIRATSIRGHLRFWWRLLYGDVDTAKMRARESEVWGSVDNPSPVCVEVKCKNVEPSELIERGTDLAKPFGFERGQAEAYTLFPLIEDKEQHSPTILKRGFKFELKLQWQGENRLNELRAIENERREKLRRAGKDAPALPEHVTAIGDEIQGAVAAWIAWGGVGARTRRGLGAIQLSSDVENASFDSGGVRIFVGKACDKSMVAWKACVEIYRSFRQHRTRPRGRSLWPEADSIRDITGCTLKKHKARQTPTRYFPRAALGLPIVFGFQERPDVAHPDNNPAQTILEPAGSSTRFASPVITRPIFREGKWLPAVMILPVDLTSFSAELVGDRKLWSNAAPIHSTAPIATASGFRHGVPTSQIDGLSSVDTLKPLRGKANAIEAFCQYLLDAKWEQV